VTGIPTAALIACAVIVLALGALLSAGESALLRFTRAAADEIEPLLGEAYKPFPTYEELLFRC